MLGSEFVNRYNHAGLRAWEAAAIELAREATPENANLTPWPWFDLHLTDGTNNVTLKVMSDMLSIGPFGDHVRLPLTPDAAQSICNLYGWLLPTPWLVYQIWRASPLKLEPRSLPNKGADLDQYAEHSAIIDHQIDELLAPGPTPRLQPAGPVAGLAKHVVVSNKFIPKRVLIQGWYRPPPAPDVFDDGRPLVMPNGMPVIDRQPIQPISNIHGDFYVDYAHLIQPIWGTCTANGQTIPTIDIYQHPVLAKLVSNEGPVRVPRYPARVQPSAARPAHILSYPSVDLVAARSAPTIPDPSDYYLSQLPLPLPRRDGER